MSELLGPLDGVVQRVEADLGEIDRQDVAADPQHRHGAHDPDTGEERRSAGHHGAAEGARGPRAAPHGQVSPGVIDLDERPDQPVDREGDEQGDHDQDDDTSDG